MEASMMQKYMSQLWHDESLFIVALDNVGRVTYANKKTAALFGNSEGALLGENWIDCVIPSEDRQKVRARFQAIIKEKIDQYSQMGDVDVVTRRGVRLRILWSNHLLKDSEGQITGVLSFGQDITAQKHAQFRLNLHQDVARIIGESDSFTEAATLFVQTVCKRFGWDFGEVWMIDSMKNAMVWTACWNHQTEQTAWFEAESKQLTFPKGFGLPGVAWERGRPVWVEDVADNPAFLRQDDAKKIGLHSGFAFPILVGDAVVGAVDFLSHKIQSPDVGLIDLFKNVGIQLGNYYQRKKVEAQLKVWDEMFRSNGEAMMITDAKPKILAVNEAFSRLTGYEQEEVVGRSPQLLKSERHNHSFYKEMWNSLNETGTWQGEAWNRRKDGTDYLQGLTLTKMRNEKGVTTHYTATFRDNSERRAAEERIRYLVHHDALTGLPNRILLADRLNMAIARANRSNRFIVIFSIDVDRFKVVNDSLGHDVGDTLLRLLAQRLRNCVREEDTLSRPGGDEFIIVFSNIGDIGAVIPIVEKISNTIRMPLNIGDMDFNLSASIGISVYPHDGLDREALLKNADAAMNFAKETGRNQYHFFTTDLNRVVSDRLRIETNLRKALEREEFFLHYQPQIDIRTLRVVGVEALIRWRQPEEGMISPATFIPVAEESGLIVPIGDWILAKASSQWREWSAMGRPPITLAVNISAIQFYKHDFLEKIARNVKECGLDSFLEIEVTEGVMMKNMPVTLDIMHKLKAIGCKLSIDDFGTGYSSLGYISRFPIDKLKIDQSFVRAMLASRINMAIVDTVIRLANNLNLQVIAEGVETQDELAALQARNCDEVQGYFFARPMPVEELLPWWEKWNREHGHKEK